MESKNILIVTSRFYSEISESLEKECIETVKSYGFGYDIIDVPGAFEVPAIIAHKSKKNKYFGYIALGCVIRGGTPHFEYVAGECVKGIGQVSLQTGVPVAFGVLTVDSIEQAIERSGTKAGNKGAEAALSIQEMITLFKNLDA